MQDAQGREVSGIHQSFSRQCKQWLERHIMPMELKTPLGSLTRRSDSSDFGSLPICGGFDTLGRDNARYLEAICARLRDSVRRTDTTDQSGSFSRDCGKSQHIRISMGGRHEKERSPRAVTCGLGESVWSEDGGRKVRRGEEVANR